MAGKWLAAIRLSLVERSMANFAAADLDGLVRVKLKKIQDRPHLIDGCLAATGLKIEPLVTGDHMLYEFKLVSKSVRVN